MKKILCVFLIVSLMTSLFVGCKKTDEKASGNQTTVNVIGLKGPTTMGMVKLIEDSKENGEYSFEMATSANEVLPKMLKGQVDIAAVPINVGSVLYNKSNSGVKMIAINTLGVSYIVEKNGKTVNAVSDLKGKTVYATGKGSVPEYAVRFLLEKSGISEKDVQIVWKNEPTEIVSIMATKDNAVALLPQPFVTVALNKLKDLRIALDLTKEWESVDNNGALITSGIFVRNDFAKRNPELVKKFLKDYRKSVDYVNTNVNASAKLIDKQGIVDAAIAKTAIPYCNLVCIDGKKMKKYAKNFIGILNKENVSSIGGKMPKDDFYLIYE
ncbi:MAG: ABC transporter substrate-binding protein [Clostridia bacterium]|nr:ABC transporter substrate-binding protein [Clostridia bacterium]